QNSLRSTAKHSPPCRTVQIGLDGMTQPESSFHQDQKRNRFRTTRRLVPAVRSSATDRPSNIRYEARSADSLRVRRIPIPLHLVGDSVAQSPETTTSRIPAHHPRKH